MGGRGGAPRTNLDTVIAQAAARAQAPVAAPQSLDDRILASIDSLPRHWRVSEWATLKGLRDALPDVTSTDLERTLKVLDRQDRIELIWDFDAKNVNAPERAAGFQFGGKLVTAFRRR